MGRLLGIYALIAIVTAACYARLIPFGFVGWDDARTLTQNRDFNPPTADTFPTVWSSPRAGLYVPVSYTTWTILSFLAYNDEVNEHGTHLDPVVFRVANIVLHVGSALVCFALLRRLTHHDLSALAGALVFALHPVQVETVAWISGLKDLLFGLLSLTTILFYVIYARRCHRDRSACLAGGSLALLGLGTVAFVLAMLSKPTAIVVPAIVIVIDRFLIGRRWLHIMQTVAPWIALSLPVIVLTSMVQPTHGVPPVPLWWRPIIAMDALAFYAGKLVWPAELAIDYGRTPSVGFEQGMRLFTWVVPVTIGLGAGFARRRFPSPAVGVLVFAIGLLPVLGLVTFSYQVYSTVADHYLYLPMFGIGLVAAGILARLRGPVAASIATVVVLALAARTVVQEAHWSDPKRIWLHTIDVNPRSASPHQNLGALYFSDGQMQPAIEHFNRALEIEPDFHPARYNLSMALIQEGRSAEALVELAKLLRIEKTLPAETIKAMPHLQYAAGLALFREGHYEWAANHFRRALEQNPNHPTAGQYLREAEARIRPPATAPTAR